MATGVIGQSQIAQSLKVMFAEAQTFMEHKAIAKGTFDVRTLPRKMGASWNQTALPPLSAVDLTDGELFDSPQQISDQKITITPAEVGAQLLFTKKAFAQSFLDPSMLGELLAEAIEYKRDTHLLGQYDNSGGVLGTTSTTLTVDLVAKGVAAIKAGRAIGSGSARTGARTTGDPVPAPYFAMFHGYNEFDIRSQLSGLGGAPTQVTTAASVMNFAGNTINEWMAKWIQQGTYVGEIAGAKFLVDNNFTITSNAIKGGIYAQKARVHVEFAGLETYDVKMTDGRATLMTATADFGTGERADVWSIEVAVDASAPA